MVAQAQAGDFDAFGSLISGQKDKIYALARKLTGNDQDAQDIVQDTFLKAIDKIDQFRAESSFGTWLYAIALNQARAFYARMKQHDLRPIEDYLPSAHASEDSDSHRLFDWKDPEQVLRQSEMRRTIDSLIAGLPYKYREAFVLRYLEELPVKKVAAIIGESEAATKSRILRARLALRDQLAPVLEDRHE